MSRNRRGFLEARVRWWISSRSCGNRSSCGRRSSIRSLVFVVGVLSCFGSIVSLGLRGGERTQLMTDPSTCSYTTDTSSSQCSGRVAFLFLLFLAVGVAMRVAVRVAVATMSAWVAVTSRIAMLIMPSVSVAKKTALIVATWLSIGSTVTWWSRGRSVRTLGSWRVSRWVPLGTACGLVDVVPALAVLIKLCNPAWGHGRRSTVLANVSACCERRLVSEPSGLLKDDICIG